MAGRRAAWWAVVALLTVGTVVAAAIGVWELQAKKPDVVVVDGPDQRGAVEEVVSTGVERIFAFTPETFESNKASVQDLMTAEYRAEFAEKAPGTDVLGSRSVEAKVVGTAIVTLDESSATVLAFLNRTVTEPGKEPVYDGSRLDVGLKRVDGEWLIDGITPV